jgi:hypothetical protein
MDDAERERLMVLIDEWKVECSKARAERDEARAQAAKYRSFHQAKGSD